MRTSHSHQLRILVAVCALACILNWALGPDLAKGKMVFVTITVYTTANDNTVNGNCTLREAIIAANSNAGVFSKQYMNELFYQEAPLRLIYSWLPSQRHRTFIAVL